MLDPVALIPLLLVIAVQLIFVLHALDKIYALLKQPHAELKQREGE